MRLGFVFTLVSLAPFFGGCSGLMKYDVSVLSGVSTSQSDAEQKSIPWTVKTAWPRNVVVRIPTLTITVEPQNECYTGLTVVGLLIPFVPVHDKPDTCESPRLRFWTEVKAAKDEVVFDPSRVELRDAQGITVKATVIFPGKTPRQGAGQILRKRCENIDLTEAVAGRFTISDARCFIFFFETDGSPQHEFTLVFGGLEQRGQIVPSPAITFKPGSVWVWVTVP